MLKRGVGGPVWASGGEREVGGNRTKFTKGERKEKSYLEQDACRS